MDHGWTIWRGPWRAASRAAERSDGLQRCLGASRSAPSPRRPCSPITNTSTIRATPARTSASRFPTISGITAWSRSAAPRPEGQQQGPLQRRLLPAGTELPRQPVRHGEYLSLLRQWHEVVRHRLHQRHKRSNQLRRLRQTMRRPETRLRQRHLRGGLRLTRRSLSGRARLLRDRRQRLLREHPDRQRQLRRLRDGLPERHLCERRLQTHDDLRSLWRRHRILLRRMHQHDERSAELRQLRDGLHSGLHLR